MSQINDKDRAAQLLDIVVAEWKSDPQSVVCFDSSIVREASEIVERLRIAGDLYYL